MLAYFECPGNPAGPDTLAKYKNIVCGEDEHTEGMVPMILGLLVSAEGVPSRFFVRIWAAC